VYIWDNYISNFWFIDLIKGLLHQVAKIKGFYENVVYIEPIQYDIRVVHSIFILDPYLMDNLAEVRRLQVNCVWQCTD